MPEQREKWWQTNAVALGQIGAGVLLIAVNVGLWIGAVWRPELTAVSTKMEGSMLGVAIGMLIVGNGFRQLSDAAIERQKLRELEKQTKYSEATVKQNDTLIDQGNKAAVKVAEVAEVESNDQRKA